MKKMISAFMILIMLSSLAACQPTPDEAIVVQKDVERMVEQAGSSENGAPMNALAIPAGEYSFACSGLDGRLSITVRATVQHPDTAAMPIIRVKKAGFSQAAVTGIFNYLFPHEKPYDLSGNTRTKEVVATEILHMKNRLADGSYASDLGFGEEEYREMIAALEAEYRLAPETAPETLRSDGTMRLTEIQNAGRHYSLNVCSDPSATNTSKTLRVNSADASSQEAMMSSFGSHLSYHDGAAPEYTTLGIQRTDGTNTPAALSISFSEALKLCDDLFAAAGLSDDFCYGSAFLVDDRGIGQYSGSGKEMGAPAKNYAYKIYYTRAVGGIPTFVNMDWAKTDVEYAIPWSYECICFTIDNSGIRHVRWDNPIAIAETIQDNASLKPFDEIVEIFETMVKVQYEAETDLWTGGSGTMDIAIDAIQLCLVRIREQDGGAAGLLVPAWVFYGNNELTSKDGRVSYDLDHGSAGSWHEEPYPVLIINAIDGSLIDLARGY